MSIALNLLFSFECISFGVELFTVNNYKRRVRLSRSNFFIVMILQPTYLIGGMTNVKPVLIYTF